MNAVIAVSSVFAPAAPKKEAAVSVPLRALKKVVGPRLSKRRARPGQLPYHPRRVVADRVRLCLKPRGGHV